MTNNIILIEIHTKLGNLLDEEKSSYLEERTRV